MRKNKLISVLGLSLAVVGLASCGGDVDTTLYKLTLSTNIDEKLTEDQKGQLLAVYGYGQPGREIVEGVRPQEDIEELKKAGATDEDIAKVGKRQSDGSYYFYEQDPIYIKTPTVEGYYLDAMYYKGTNNLAFTPGLTKGWDQTEYTQNRWNMDAKNVELEARYKVSSYHPSFQNLSDDVTNPNTLPQNYSFVADGEITLAPATSSNPHKHFVAWTYQKYVEGVWTTFQITSLPKDYEESTLDIGAIWEIDYLKVNFEFKEYVDPETINDLTWSDTVTTMSISSNLAKVDGVAVGSRVNTTITSSSVVEVDGENGDIQIFYNLKPEFEIFHFELNGERNDQISASHMNPPYVNLTKEFLTADSTITFVVSRVLQ